MYGNILLVNGGGMVIECWFTVPSGKTTKLWYIHNTYRWFSYIQNRDFPELPVLLAWLSWRFIEVFVYEAGIKFFALELVQGIVRKKWIDRQNKTLSLISTLQKLVVSWVQFVLSNQAHDFINLQISCFAKKTCNGRSPGQLGVRQIIPIPNTQFACRDFLPQTDPIFSTRLSRYPIGARDGSKLT